MKSRLSFIAQKENLVLSDECIEKIHEISEGDARKAIMILQNTKYIYKMKKNIKNYDYPVVSVFGLCLHQILKLVVKSKLN